jgi:hypothetical protein
MGDCDFRRVFSQYRRSAIDELYISVRNCVRGKRSLNKILQSTGQVISGSIGCITDDYSLLRYSLYFLQSFINDRPQKLSYLEEKGFIRSSVQELYFWNNLRHGKKAGEFLGESRDLLEYWAVMRGIVCAKSPVSLQDLLEQLGRSDYVDSLIRDILRDQVHRLKEQAIGELFRHKILDRRVRMEIAIPLLDFAAEHRLELLTDYEIEGLFRQWEGQVQATLALLRFIGECRLITILPLLYRMLQNTLGGPLALSFGIVDVLGQIGDERSLRQLDQLRDKVVGLPDQQKASPLLEYIDLARVRVCPSFKAFFMGMFTFPGFLEVAG